MLLFGQAQRLLRLVEPADHLGVSGLRPCRLSLEAVAVLLGGRQPVGQFDLLVAEGGHPPLAGQQAGLDLGEISPVALQASRQRLGRAPGLGQCLGCGQGPAVAGAVAVGGQPLAGGLLGRGQGGTFRADGLRLLARGGQLGVHLGRLGLQVGHHVGVGSRVEGGLQAPAALAQHAGQASRPFDQALHPSEGGRQVGLTAGRQLVRGPARLLVELGHRRTPPGLGRLEIGPLGSGRLTAAVQCPQLLAGLGQPQAVELTGQLVVGAGGGGLALEGADLPLDLAHEVEEAFEVLVGGGQPPLGPLATAAVLEHAGGLLDHGPTVLGARAQDGVELALADDHVLLAPHARVREQLLDVEEAAGCAVDGVLALARPEQGAGDGDLGQIGGQLAGRIVDGQADLGPAEGRPGHRAGEDDVLHLRRAHRPGPLGAEHPGHRVDDVRLAAAVGADHDRDAGLEFEHGGVGEGLESPEGEGLQEHRALTLPPGRDGGGRPGGGSLARPPAAAPPAHTWQCSHR